MRPTRALIPLLVASSVLLFGCSDDGGGGSEEAFCELLASDADLDIETPEGQEAFQEAMDAAPDEVSDDMEVLADAFEELSGVDENDPEALAAAFEVMADPEVMAAMSNIENFGVEKCGMDPGFMTGETPTTEE